jgi:hypothetical protein
MNTQLTDEQIENWRKVLLGMFGPYALLMSKEQIQAYRDKMQKDIDSTDRSEAANEHTTD